MEVSFTKMEEKEEGTGWGGKRVGLDQMLCLFSVLFIRFCSDLHIWIS